jgi:hypothetical protein
MARPEGRSLSDCVIDGINADRRFQEEANTVFARHLGFCCLYGLPEGHSYRDHALSTKGVEGLLRALQEFERLELISLELYEPVPRSGVGDAYAQFMGEMPDSIHWQGFQGDVEAAAA